MEVSLPSVGTGSGRWRTRPWAFFPARSCYWRCVLIQQLQTMKNRNPRRRLSSLALPEQGEPSANPTRRVPAIGRRCACEAPRNLTEDDVTYLQSSEGDLSFFLWVNAAGQMGCPAALRWNEGAQLPANLNSLRSIEVIVVVVEINRPRSCGVNVRLQCVRSGTHSDRLTARTGIKASI